MVLRSKMINHSMKKVIEYHRGKTLREVAEGDLEIHKPNS